MRDGIKPQNLRHYQIKRLQMEIKNDETEHFSILPLMRIIISSPCFLSLLHFLYFSQSLPLSDMFFHEERNRKTIYLSPVLHNHNCKDLPWIQERPFCMTETFFSLVFLKVDDNKLIRTRLTRDSTTYKTVTWNWYQVLLQCYQYGMR